MTIHEICQVVGKFYLHEANWDYQVAADNCHESGITNIELIENKILEITTAFPGKFIGAKGTRYSDFVKYLKESYGWDFRLKESQHHFPSMIVPIDYETEIMESMADYERFNAIEPTTDDYFDSFESWEQYYDGEDYA